MLDSRYCYDKCNNEIPFFFMIKWLFCLALDTNPADKEMNRKIMFLLIGPYFRDRRVVLLFYALLIHFQWGTI